MILCSVHEFTQAKISRGVKTKNMTPRSRDSEKNPGRIISVISFFGNFYIALDQDFIAKVTRSLLVVSVFDLVLFDFRDEWDDLPLVSFLKKINKCFLVKKSSRKINLSIVKCQIS